jgi:hypothetical protein
MAKYTVTIPPPSAKRMAAFGKIVIKLFGGFDGEETVKTYQLQEGTRTFEFEVPNEYQWIYSNSIIDGFCFDVSCEYANSTNTRTETKRLVPFC